VLPAVETAPVLSHDDAADDPAIWIHPTDPGRSVVIGTDKRSGLLVFDLSGALLQSVPDGRMNNVDVATGFRLDGELADLAIASCRDDDTIAVYRIDAGSRRLHGAGPRIATGLEEAYGLCVYRSERTGELYAFVSDKSGLVQQWRLSDAPGAGSGVSGELVRTIEVGETVEGMVADATHGALYVGEEEVGLWRYGAEPDGGSRRALVDRVAPRGRPVADIEGLAVYSLEDGTGLLIASSQGDDTFAVYAREGGNEYLFSFSIGANEEAGIDGVTHTDGIAVTERSLGAAFAQGLFVAQDDENTDGGEVLRQNFKLVPWERIERAMEEATGGKRGVP